LRDRIIAFSRKYEVIAEPEFPISNRQQIVDIFLKIISKDEDDIAYILIENKIKKEAFNPHQARKQFDCFKYSENYVKDLPIYSVVLTTDNEKFSTMHKNVISANEDSVWLKWTNYKDADNSIETILRRLIKNEHEAHIQPIDPNTQFIIKSFIDYIVTEYSYRESGQKNFSFNGFDVVATVSVEVDHKKYIIKRFENNMIRLFNENENALEIDVKPILRRVNEVYDLNIDLYHGTGSSKNTQILGREIINRLNEM